MSFLGYDKLRLGEFFGLSTFQYLAYFRRSLFYGFISVYLGVELGLSTVQVLLMATLGMIANAGSQAFIWGNLLDKFKRSALFVVIGEVIAGLGHIGIYYWHLFALETGNLIYAGFTIIIGLALVEVFWSQSNVGWSALISELTEEEKRKKLMSQLSIIGGLGGISGATLGGFLYLSGEGFENGILFFIPAVIMVLSAIAVQFTIRDHTERLDTTSDVSVIDGEEVLNENGEKVLHVKRKLSDLPNNVVSIYLLFLLALVFINFGRNSIAIISSLYIVDQGTFNATDQELALFRNVSSAATIVTGILLGSILAETDDTKVMMSGILFALIALIWMIFAPSFELVLLASFLIGATHVIIQASSYAIVAKIIPIDYRGRLFSYYNATFFLSWGLGGQFVAAPIADLLINRGYSKAFAYQMSFVSAIVMVVLGLLIFLLFLRKLISYQEETKNETEI